MLLKRLLIDAGLAVALAAMLGIVFVIDRNTPEPVDESGQPFVEGDSSSGTLIQTKRRGTMKAGSIYQERTAENREVVARKRGGSPISEAAVEDGLAWLARHQLKDGSWSDRSMGIGPLACCDQRTPCTGPGWHFPVGQTGLALLAFLGGGHFSFNETPYSPHVKNGLDWLVAQQDKSGRLTKENHQHWAYEHCIAAFALAEACALSRHSGEEPDPKYLQATQLAIDYLEKIQHADGGWRYTDNVSESSDTSVSGWAVLALKSAQSAELKMDPRRLEKVLQFFKKCEFARGQTGYQAGGGLLTHATTGVGMLVHHFLLNQSDTPLIKAAAPLLAEVAELNWKNGQGTPDYYTWYNCTLGMYLAGGEHWDRWNKVVRDRVVGLQAKNGCEKGSWPPNDQWSGSGGRIYSTALAILTLEVYYRFARKEDPLTR